MPLTPRTHLRNHERITVNESSLRLGGLSAVSKIMVVVVLATLLSALTAGVAYAASIDCPNRANGACVGTDKADDIEGTKQEDRISGLAGSDTIRGLGRADFIHGNVGKDTLYGQGGGDTLKGDTEADTLIGREGNDRLFAGRDLNPDVLSCGPGTDSATVSLGDLVQTEAGDLVPVLATTVEADLELLTTCENVNIIILQ